MPSTSDPVRFVTKYGNEFWLILYDPPPYWKITYLEQGSQASLFGDELAKHPNWSKEFKERLFRRQTLTVSTGEYMGYTWFEYWEEGRVDPKYTFNIAARRKRILSNKQLSRKYLP